MGAADYITIYAMATIWSLMFVNVVLTIGGFLYYQKAGKTDGHVQLKAYPFVSVLVPAHNEGVVISRTVQALLAFDYPQDRYEIIIISDNSTDNTRQVLEDMQEKYPDRRLIVVNTDTVVGGRGKSNALNIGAQVARGSVFAIYDADNTPEPQALRLLVENLMADDTLAATIGKFRTRNRNANVLTRFINIETLLYQCMNQAGRWFYFKICTIPGTNFAIRRSVVEQMGGWDPNALAEDTEISFRIYRMGYRIKMIPQAVTWEQEPFTVSIWFKQRTRWAVGNIYVLVNNFKFLFDRNAGKMRLDIFYYTLIYALMLSALAFSDIIFLLSILGYLHIALGGFSVLLWILASVLFVINAMVALSQEKNEFSASTTFLCLLMLFSYSKLWMLVVLKGIYLSVKMAYTKREVKWYKTERSAD
ncbi:MAG TPA: glycosyltransferase [Candidatus Limiplasma sp.]|nr:glycosyltransferase [Candidatus Limiplasma sp.]